MGGWLEHDSEEGLRVNTYANYYGIVKREQSVCENIPEVLLDG